MKKKGSFWPKLQSTRGPVNLALRGKDIAQEGVVEQAVLLTVLRKKRTGKGRGPKIPFKSICQSLSFLQ